MNMVAWEELVLEDWVWLQISHVLDRYAIKTITNSQYCCITKGKVQRAQFNIMVYFTQWVWVSWYQSSFYVYENIINQRMVYLQVISDVQCNSTLWYNRYFVCDVHLAIDIWVVGQNEMWHKLVMLCDTYHVLEKLPNTLDD